MERAGAEDMGDEVERKGLGTPATRADVIEKLVRDGFVKREKKRLVPTKEGMELIAVLPDIVKSPKLTADWENALTLVAKGVASHGGFYGGDRRYGFGAYSGLSGSRRRGEENLCAGAGGTWGMPKLRWSGDRKMGRRKVE